MADNVSSLNIDLLSAHLESGRRIATDSESGRAELATFESNVIVGCPSNYWDGKGVALAADLIALWTENNGAATVIRDLVAVDASGEVTIADNVIAEALLDQGYSQPPEEIAVELGEAVGLFPMSGFADDPVCTFNGNFIYIESDLTTPGFAELIDVERTYNSLMAERRGVFGRGWTSVLDMALSVTVDGASVIIADGAEVPFALSGEGGYLPNRRRRLTLEAVDGGWTLHHGFDHQWHFDNAGRLSGGHKQGGSFTVTRADRSVTIEEHTSGRSMRYNLDPGGLVETVAASDGRSASYHYHDGHCVAVSRSIGDMTYTIETDRIVAVVDADGVVLCRNTYDDQGRIATQLAPHGAETTYAYDDNHTTRLTYGHNDAANMYFHDERGRLVAMFGSDGRAMRSTFDQHDRVTEIVERSGATFTYSYDDEPADDEPADDEHTDDEHARSDFDDQWTRRTDEQGGVEERSFDRHGRLLRHVDANGGVHEYGYRDRYRLPVLVRNPMGGETRIELDANGLPVGVTDADGFGHRIERNSDGLVKIVVDSSGQFLQHDYDAAGRLVSVADAAGTVTEQQFDEGGRVLVVRGGAEPLRNYSYSPAGRMVGCEVSSGGSWMARYGPHGDLIAFIDSIGGTVGFGYDEVGNPTSMTLPDGGRFTTDFDALGQVTASCDPAGNRFEQAIDARGRNHLITDGHGATWHTAFDTAGRLSSQTDPAEEMTSFVYHPAGQLAATGNSAGVVRYEINAAGWTTAVVDADGGRTAIDYSSAGRPLARVSPAGRSVRFHYDDGGSLAAIVDEDGTDVLSDIATSGVPGDAGLAELVPANLAAPGAAGPAQLDPDLVQLVGDQPPHFGGVLGAIHRLLNGGRADAERRDSVWTGSIDPFLDPYFDPAAAPVAAPVTASGDAGNGHAGDWDRDERGLVRRIVDPAGVATEFVNDIMGRPMAISNADGATTSIAYGPIGGVASITNALGETTTAERSLAGRLERVRFSDGTGYDYTYDLLGRLSTVAAHHTGGTSAAGSSTLASSYRYGPAGHLLSATTPGGTVTAGHGPNGELESTVGLDRSTVVYERDADGLVARRTHSDGTDVEYVRTSGGRITAMVDSVAGAVVVPELPSPDSWAPPGRLAPEAAAPAGAGAGGLEVEQRDEANRIVADRHGRTHRYDDAGRLLESLNTQGDRWHFTYDAVGLLSREHHPHRGTRHFVHNAARQLIAIETETGLGATFGYDGAGRRVSAEFSNGERVAYHWQGLHQLRSIERIDGHGRISQRRIIYSGFGRPELVDDIAIGWEDAMTGKPVQIGDRRYLRAGLDVRRAVPEADWHDGTVDDPWGDIYPGSDPGIHSGNSGHSGASWLPDEMVGIGLGYRNELCVDGLVFMGDRVYEPASRSFLTVDPLPAVPGDNAFSGVYVYAANDPVNLVDPSGRRPLTIDEFAEKRAELERSRFGNFVHPVTRWAPTAGLVIRVAPELMNTVAVLGLSYVIGAEAERRGLGPLWNHVYGNYVVPGTVQRLYAAAGGESDPLNRGDLGGTFTTDVRQPFLAAGETEEQRGLNALVRGLEDTGNPDQIQTDEFEIVDHGNGSYTLVLPGVTDLSAPVLGFDPYDQSVRDNDQGAVYSLQSASIDDNIYAAYVAEYLENNSDVPPGSDLMIIGHSYGADTAMDLAADDEFASTYNVTHVVAAAYNSGPQTPFVNADTRVLVLENANDKAVIGEVIGHGPFVEPDVDPTDFDNIVYRHFDGGNVGIGHHQDNYIDYMVDADDPEMTAFFESIDLAGFTRPGKADAVDISLQD